MQFAVFANLADLYFEFRFGIDDEPVFALLQVDDFGCMDAVQYHDGNAPEHGLVQREPDVARRAEYIANLVDFIDFLPVFFAEVIVVRVRIDYGLLLFAYATADNDKRDFGTVLELLQQNIEPLIGEDARNVEDDALLLDAVSRLDFFGATQRLPVDIGKVEGVLRDKRLFLVPLAQVFQLRGRIEDNCAADGMDEMENRILELRVGGLDVDSVIPVNHGNLFPPAIERERNDELVLQVQKVQAHVGLDFVDEPGVVLGAEGGVVPYVANGKVHLLEIVARHMKFVTEFLEHVEELVVDAAAVVHHAVRNQENLFHRARSVAISRKSSFSGAPL